MEPTTNFKPSYYINDFLKKFGNYIKYNMECYYNDNSLVPSKISKYSHIGYVSNINIPNNNIKLMLSCTKKESVKKIDVDMDADMLFERSFSKYNNQFDLSSKEFEFKVSDIIPILLPLVSINKFIYHNGVFIHPLFQIMESLNLIVKYPNINNAIYERPDVKINNHQDKIFEYCFYNNNSVYLKVIYNDEMKDIKMYDIKGAMILSLNQWKTIFNYLDIFQIDYHDFIETNQAINKHQ